MLINASVNFISNYILVGIISLMVFGGNKSHANEMNLKYIGASGDIKNYVVTDASFRIGKGVFVWILNDVKEFMSANGHFVTCDGKSASSIWEIQMSFAESRNERLEDIKGLIKKIELTPTSVIEINKWEEEMVQGKDGVRPVLKDLCKTAAPETKGILMPFFISKADEKKKIELSSLMLGTFSRRNNFVEGWIKSYNIEEYQFKDTSGNVVKGLNGAPMMAKRRVDDSYWMNKIVVDCRENKYAIKSDVRFDIYGKSKGDVSSSGKFEFYEPVPNTKGEALIQFFCTVY